MGSLPRTPLLLDWHAEFAESHDAAAFTKLLARRYVPATLERLLAIGPRAQRRAAAVALGLIGDYDSNAALGCALTDSDRGVRLAAEDSIRSVWARVGTTAQRERLATILRLNEMKQYRTAIARSTELIREAQWCAEAWNQRAVAHFGLHRFVESIGDCREALELNPYHFAAAAGMGKCYLQLGNTASALDCFHRALRINPGLEGVRANVQQLERTNRPKQ
ncbi:MAG TPA: tetratricopeptide repeat protein [Pirellulales bacterium]